MFAWLNNFNVGKKIGFGFGLMTILLAGLVGHTLSEVSKLNMMGAKVSTVGMPAALNSPGMLNSKNRSLAALRSYMLFGQDKFKTERAETRAKQIGPAFQELKKLSLNWKDQKNIQSIPYPRLACIVFRNDMQIRGQDRRTRRS